MRFFISLIFIYRMVVSLLEVLFGVSIFLIHKESVVSSPHETIAHWPQVLFIATTLLAINIPLISKKNKLFAIGLLSFIGGVSITTYAILKTMLRLYEAQQTLFYTFPLFIVLLAVLTRLFDLRHLKNEKSQNSV